MTKARSIVDVILGEATHGTRAQRYADMLAIASVIANRARLTNTTPEQVISAPGQFDAYGKSLPKGADAYRDLAEQAVRQVEIEGPVHNATFYATPSATKNLPKGLDEVTRTSGHVYYTDPQNRPIATAKGYVRPVADALANLSNAAVQTVNAVTAPVQNAAAALRTAAFDPVVAAIPSIPTPPARPTITPPAHDLPPRAMSPVSYNLGPRRPNPPGQELVGRLQQAVTDTLGPGYGVSITSGQGQYGSSRHRDPRGLAADIQVIDLATNQPVTDQQSLLDVAQAFSAQGGLGVGLGPEYMKGVAMHLDTVTPGPGQDHEWGSTANANAGLLADARNFALMPDSYYERHLPPSMQVPGLPSPFAAPAGTVDRMPLEPLLARPSVPQRPVTPTPPAALAAMNNVPPNAPANGWNLVPQAHAATMPAVPRQPSRPVSPTPAAALASMTLPAPGPLPPARPTVTPPARPVTPTPPAALAAMTAPTTTAGIPPVPSLMSPELMGPEQTFAQQPVQPTFVPAVPQEVQPPVAPPPVKPPSVRVGEAHAASSFPAAPKMPSAADVYAGRASVGVASDGSMVSRNSYGGVSITNKYGATTTMTPSGHMAVSYGGPPSVANPGIEGPLGSPGITTPKQGGGLFGIQPAKTETGNLARGVAGAMAGSAIGSLAGPAGSIIGAAIGRSIAQGRNPLDALTGGSGTFAVDTSRIGSILGETFGPTTRFYTPNTRGAMGTFPGAPTGVRGALGGNQSNRSAAGMRSISPAAAGAISRGAGGLY